MTAVRLLSKLLGFKRFCAVWHRWERRQRDSVVEVKPYQNGCRGPKCGNRGKNVRTLRSRIWRDGRVFGQTVWLEYSPREIRCRTHGQVVEEIPWAAAMARMTYRFEYTMLRMCSDMTQRRIRVLYG